VQAEHLYSQVPPSQERLHSSPVGQVPQFRSKPQSLRNVPHRAEKSLHVVFGVRHVWAMGSHKPASQLPQRKVVPHPSSKAPQRLSQVWGTHRPLSVVPPSPATEPSSLVVPDPSRAPSRVAPSALPSRRAPSTVASR
jgi:hypothetical protein